jgi:hypothetical protein
VAEELETPEEEPVPPGKVTMELLLSMLKMVVVAEEKLERDQADRGGQGYQ